MGLTAKVLLGMLLGIVIGLFINFSGLYSEGSFTAVYIIDGLFHVVGKLFVNALKNVILFMRLPLVKRHKF